MERNRGEAQKGGAHELFLSEDELVRTQTLSFGPDLINRKHKSGGSSSANAARLEIHVFNREDTGGK